MVKKISISMPEWIYNEYLSEIKSNKSAYLIEMFILGVKETTNDLKIKTSQVSNLLQENRSYKDEIKRLNAILGKYNKKYGSVEEKAQREREELEAKRVKAFHESLRRSGHLASVGERR